MSRVMVRHPVPSVLAKHADHVHSVVEGRRAEPTSAEVSNSWHRSVHQHRVDPDGHEAPRILTSREVSERREPLDQLILSAQDELDRLYKLVREAGYTLLFCDNAGVAVEHRGNQADASRFRYWGTWLGGVWDEAFEGTNGIGTVISEERPVTIHRSQHYRTRHIDLSCSGAPIFGTDGRLMAVLDVSAVDPALSERAHALTGVLTIASARAIEERFFGSSFDANGSSRLRCPNIAARECCWPSTMTSASLAQTEPHEPRSCSTMKGSRPGAASGPSSKETARSFECATPATSRRDLSSRAAMRSCRHW